MCGHAHGIETVLAEAAFDEIRLPGTDKNANNGIPRLLQKSGRYGRIHATRKADEYCFWVSRVTFHILLRAYHV